MKIIGKSYPIHDAYGKITGKIKYAGDMILPRMAYVVIITSDIPHGKILSINSEELLKVPGVIDILTPFNTINKKYSRYKTREDQKVELTEQIFNNHVRFVGDKIGALVAESEDIARKAIKLLKVEYEEYPAAFTCEDALSGKIDNIFDNGVICASNSYNKKKSNINQSECVEIFTTTELQRLHHAAMETHACVVDYNYSDENIVVYSPNQSVFGLRTTLANLFDIPNHKLRVVKTTMGGSFGAKQEWIVEPIALACALKVKRPIKLVLNREECMITSVSRAPIKNTLKTTYTKDGFIKQFDIDVLINAGAYVGNSVPYIATMLSKFSRTYKYDNINYNAKAIITNTPVSGAFRGWTAAEAALTIEHNLNEASKVLNLDPLELRLKNCLLEGDLDIQTEVSLGSIKIKECLELGREKFEWDKRKEECINFNKGNKRYKKGIAVACGGHVSGFYPKVIDYSRVDLIMTDHGKIIANITLHDHGCGTITAFKMIIAEVLTLNINDIIIGEGDTGKTPYDLGCYSSRTTYVVGRATQNCSIKIKHLILDIASRILKLEISALNIEEGYVISKSDKDIKLSFKDIVYHSMFVEQKEVFASEHYKNESNPGTTAAHFSQVEVDTYTGMTKVLKYVAVHDIGKVINKEISIAQIQGAILMGIGGTISEKMLTNDFGKTTGSFKDYHLINAYEIPDTEIYFIEDGNTEGPFGAKSIGEVAMVPVTATISGAINNALNSSLEKMPLNPDTIVRYLQTKGVE
ncbi:MAG: xanthine dehydrogenase family protein molybdopterin-binding subunit [Cetobacterium sp.]|uniref:xanthine dehydrogenase family protein molybdopterin-binding subunit n=1 Tax=Cetobacterium sp. TaxID=2071632 RepID=UPI003F33A48B